MIFEGPIGKPAVRGIHWEYFFGAGQFQAIVGNGAKTTSSGYLKKKHEAGRGKEDVLPHDVISGRISTHGHTQPVHGVRHGRTRHELMIGGFLFDFPVSATDSSAFVG